MAALSNDPPMPTGGWGPIRPCVPPAKPVGGVKRGTSRRRGKNRGASSFFLLPVEERAMTYWVSRAGRQPTPRGT